MRALALVAEDDEISLVNSSVHVSEGVVERVLPEPVDEEEIVAHDLHEETVELDAAEPMMSSARTSPSSTSWVASLRRRLDDKSSCRTVSTTYDCNCRCAVFISRKACSVSCMPYWRSFIPIRVTTDLPEVGFEAWSQRAHVQSVAVDGFNQMLTVNGTTKYKALQLNVTDSNGHLQNFDQIDPEWLDEFDSDKAFVPQEAEGYHRIVTVQYEHHGSRRNAMMNLERPEFYPNTLSPCFFDPDWILRPYDPLVPHTELAFASEMGYSVWKWLLLLLSLFATAVWFVLIFRPYLLGGEEVVDSFTTIDAGVSVRTNYFGFSMF